MKKLFLPVLFALTAMGAVAQQTAIYPKPQQVEWGTAKAFDNTVAYTLVGADDADERTLQFFFGVTHGIEQATVRGALGTLFHTT